MNLPKGYNLNQHSFGNDKQLIELARSPWSVEKMTKLASLRAKYVTEPYCYIKIRSDRTGLRLKKNVHKWYAKQYYIINNELYFWQSERLNGKGHARDITMVEPRRVTREDIELARKYAEI